MKPVLCAAGVQLRDQIDFWFPDRSTASPEGWLGDSRHSRTKSDHNPDKSGVVRAIDIGSVDKGHYMVIHIQVQDKTEYSYEFLVMHLHDDVAQNIQLQYHLTIKTLLRRKLSNHR